MARRATVVGVILAQGEVNVMVNAVTNSNSTILNSLYKSVLPSSVAGVTPVKATTPAARTATNGATATTTTTAPATTSNTKSASTSTKPTATTTNNTTNIKDAKAPATPAKSTNTTPKLSADIVALLQSLDPSSDESSSDPISALLNGSKSSTSSDPLSALLGDADANNPVSSLLGDNNSSKKYTDALLEQSRKAVAASVYDSAVKAAYKGLQQKATSQAYNSDPINKVITYYQSAINPPPTSTTKFSV